MNPLIALLGACAAAWAGSASAPHPQLQKAESEARQSVEEHKAESLQRYQALERLRKDLRYISEELDRERVGGKDELKEFSEGGLERLQELRKKGHIDPKLGPALDALERLYREMPSKSWAEQYPRGLNKAIAMELRWIADESQSEPELLALLAAQLALPELEPGEDDAFSSQALFPTDVPLARFKKLGPIRIFLVKHRLRRPKSHVKTNARNIVAGAHNVQAGVEIEGKVLRIYKAFDRDYCFDIGDLHIEMTPEWRLLHPKIHLPKVGETVRVRGWTYFDSFHKAEQEYDPADPVMGISRVTLWEIHPVQDVELLP